MKIKLSVVWLMPALLLVVISLCVGNQTVTIANMVNTLLAFDASNTDHLLVFHLRIPRTFLALTVGAGLAVAGLFIQVLTRNPLAEPGLLGINAGASLAVALVIAVLQSHSIFIRYIAAMLGAGVASYLVYIFAIRQQTNGDKLKLILAGVALTAMFFSVTQIITVNSDLSVFDQYRHWVVGSLAGRGYSTLVLTLILTLVCLVIAFRIAKDIDMLILGNETAVANGVDVKQTVLATFAVIVLLSGSATAAAGPLSFIGLCAPHIARYFVGNNINKLLLVTIILGALLTLLADILGRVLVYPAEVSVGIMLSLIGGPFFVLLVRNRTLAKL